MLLRHQKHRMYAAQPAKTTSNNKPAGTTVAMGGPDSDDWHGGASEHRDGGDADGETRYQARGGAADGTGRERTTLQGCGSRGPARGVLAGFTAEGVEV